MVCGVEAEDHRESALHVVLPMQLSCPERACRLPWQDLSVARTGNSSCLCYIAKLIVVNAITNGGPGHTQVFFGHSYVFVAHFCTFGRCLDSNPESCRSKQVRYQLRHPSPKYTQSHAFSLGFATKLTCSIGRSDMFSLSMVITTCPHGGRGGASCLSILCQIKLLRSRDTVL